MFEFFEVEGREGGGLKVRTKTTLGPGASTPEEVDAQIGRLKAELDEIALRMKEELSHRAVHARP